MLCSFDAISDLFPGDFVKVSKNQNNKTSYASPFSSEHCSVLLQKDFRMIPNEPKSFNIVSIQHVFFESYWSKIDGKRSTKNDFEIQSAFKEIIATTSI